MARFLEAHELPAACGFRRQDLLDNDHPCYAGHIGLGPNPQLVARIKAADLVLAIGARLGETTSQGFTLLGVPRPQTKLVHVHNDPEELGRVYQADLPILSAMDEFAEAAASLEPPARRPWAGATPRAHEDELAWRTPTRIPGQLQLGEVVAWLRDRLPPETYLTNGAGNYAIWANRHFAYRKFGTQLAPTSGSMGYGLPAAVAAKVAHPDRPVVCFAGDGCFLMTGQELATAVQYELPIIVVVVDNGMYGTIRMHQEREHPGRVSGTALRNPDFAALARAYGAFGARVETTEQFAPAFEEAIAAGRPAAPAPDPGSGGDHAARDAAWTSRAGARRRPLTAHTVVRYHSYSVGVIRAWKRSRSPCRTAANSLQKRSPNQCGNRSAVRNAIRAASQVSGRLLAAWA